jgi:hypothetical protein
VHRRPRHPLLPGQSLTGFRCGGRATPAGRRRGPPAGSGRTSDASAGCQPDGRMSARRPDVSPTAGCQPDGRMSARRQRTANRPPRPGRGRQADASPTLFPGAGPTPARNGPRAGRLEGDRPLVAPHFATVWTRSPRSVARRAPSARSVGLEPRHTSRPPGPAGAKCGARTVIGPPAPSVKRGESSQSMAPGQERRPRSRLINPRQTPQLTPQKRHSRR